MNVPLTRSTTLQIGDAARAGWTLHPFLAATGVLMLVLFPLAIAGVFLDSRVITGAPAWLKPAKFAISIAAYTLTLAACLALLPRRTWLTRIVAGGVVLAMLVEIAAIGMQAARGVPSHFNDTTPFDALVFQMMGGAIVVTWLLTMVVAVAVVRQRDFGGALVTGVRWGLAGSVVGMALAIPMVIPSFQETPDLAQMHLNPANEGHAVGALEAGPGLPVVGWNTVGGDLRIGHAVGLHALQITPLFALLLIRFAPAWMDDRTRSRLISVFGAFWVGLSLLLTWQALRAQSLVRPDALTVGVFAGLLAVTAGAMVVLARPPRGNATMFGVLN